MTSLTTIFGLSPWRRDGLGPQMQQPLAITVIGGLTANMLFDALVIPVGYLVLEGRQADSTPTTPSPAKPVAEQTRSLGVVQG